MPNSLPVKVKTEPSKNSRDDMKYVYRKIEALQLLKAWVNESPPAFLLLPYKVTGFVGPLGFKAMINVMQQWMLTHTPFLWNMKFIR